MRHLVGIALAMVMAVTLFFARAWGYQRLLRGHFGVRLASHSAADLTARRRVVRPAARLDSAVRGQYPACCRPGPIEVARLRGGVEAVIRNGILGQPGWP